MSRNNYAFRIQDCRHCFPHLLFAGAAAALEESVLRGRHTDSIHLKHWDEKYLKGPSQQFNLSVHLSRRKAS